jgi:hypothetical protein
VTNLTDIKCFNCQNIITDTTEQIGILDQFICLSCLEPIDEMVQQSVNHSYPKLVRNITAKDGRTYSKSLEEYHNVKLESVLHELYYKKILRRSYIKKRKAMAKFLPAALTSVQLAALKKHAVCALTGSSEDVTLDHFIPLEWGHGGECLGNIYFVKQKLNASKSNMNPFKWINKISTKKHVNLLKWDQLIRQLSEQNGLGVKEFKRFVNWCERNKRSKEQLMVDNCSSLELWAAYREET